MAGMSSLLGCVHDRGASVTEVFFHNRDFSVAIDLYSKKKNDPQNFGRHSLVSELR